MALLQTRMIAFRMKQLFHRQQIQVLARFHLGQHRSMREVFRRLSQRKHRESRLRAVWTVDVRDDAVIHRSTLAVKIAEQSKHTQSRKHTIPE